MFVSFLSASMPLVKRFELDPKTKTLIKHAYPNAYEFTSHEVDIPDLPAFAQAIAQHGAAGHCLLKGSISRPLISESRAGSTDANALTDWICLDLDGAQYATTDSFLAEIGFLDYSHVVQWSASHGLDPTASGLRCHIYFELDKPMHPGLLKQLLQHLNLSCSTLRNGLKLTKTACALSWPLDVTTCQNDKLIYIAPPMLGNGLTDPVAQRVVYNRRAHQRLVVTHVIPSQSVLRGMIDKRVNELRTQAGLPARKTSNYKQSGTIEYMVKPDRAVVTDVKTERGFTYLNLNGGDSWAYFHPEDNPEYIHNFKGEPIYKTSELCPEYYAQAREAAAKGSKIFLAFRDFDSSSYWNGFYDEATEELELKPARNEKMLRDYMAQNGRDLGDFIPTWKMRYDPHDPVVVNLRDEIVNTFTPSPIMKMDVRPRADLPPLTKKVIRHVLGEDDEVVDAFNNWMACLLQFKKPNMTAWVITGIQGTGKGTLIQKVLMPILGKDHMYIARMEELEGDFTSVFENKLLVVVDEIHVASSQKQARVTAKLKNLLVEPTISIRRMYRESYMTTNYMSAIVTSNEHVAVDVSSSDRRYHVAPFVEAPLPLTKHEVEVLVPEEAYDAYCFWMSYPADRERAMRPIQTKNRQYAIDASMQSADHIAKFINEGNLAELFDLLPTNDEDDTIGRRLVSGDANARALYKNLMREIVHNVPDKLTRDELHTIFNYCVGGVPASPHKFTSYLRHHNIHTKSIKYNSRTVRGIDVDWDADPAWLAQARKELP